MNTESIDRIFSSTPASVGTFFKSNSPIVAEGLGQTPLEFLLIDRQHASPNLETIESIVRAGELHSLPSIVRISKDNRGILVNLLDLGASGLMIPQVHSADEIREIRDAVQFQRERSYAMSTRAGQFGARDRTEYMEWVDNDLALIPQIESKAGVENVAQIAQVDAVTGLMIGPADLALSYDRPIGDDSIHEIVEGIFEEVAPLDCGIGMYVGERESLEQYRDRTSFLLLGSDIGTVTSHFTEVLEE